MINQNRQLSPYAATLGLLTAILVAFGSLLPASAREAPKKVWTDPSGDAHNNDVPVPGGFDLVGGSINRDANALTFAAEHADMPATGTLPEGFRFIWHFNVDNVLFRLTIKSADVGKPDVIGGQTTERAGRVDLQGHFRLEGRCTTVNMGTNVHNCVPLAYVEGTINPGAGTIEATVPMKLVGARPGSVIQQGILGICPICWAMHTAERTVSTTVIDSASQTKTYRVPAHG